MLPLEIIYQVFNKCEESAPSIRAVCKTWKHIIDSEHSRHLENLNLSVPNGREVEAYLKLRRIIPQFFEDLKHMCACQMSCRHDVSLREAAKKFEVLDFGQLHEYITSKIFDGENMESSVVEHLDRMIARSKEYDTYASILFRTYLINTYGTLKLALRTENNHSLEYFLEGPDKADSQAHQLALFELLKRGDPLASTILQKFVSMGAEFNIEPEDRAYLGYLVHNDSRIRKVLFSIERRRNMLGVSETGVFTELHQAVLDQDISRVRQLLDEGSNPNQPDHALVSPLILAARAKSRTIFIDLLKFGADLNQQDMHGFTAMDWAMISGNTGFETQFCRGGSQENIDHAMQITTPEERAEEPEPLGLFREFVNWVNLFRN